MMKFYMIFRQPLVHFLLIGIGIFAVFEVLEEQTLAPSGLEIVVTPDKASQLAARFESDRSRRPSVQELEKLIDNFIREEMLVREAKSLSLEQNDAFIRRHLGQKMEALAVAEASSAMPPEDELRAHFAANSERFDVEARIAFEQVYLGADPPSEKVQIAFKALRGGAPARAVSSETRLPQSLPPSTRRKVDDTFNEGFFDRLLAIESEDWVGPVQSRYGSHLVRISGRIEARSPEFEEVRDGVLRDWRAPRTRAAAEAHLSELLDRYKVSRPDESQLERLTQ